MSRTGGSTVWSGARRGSMAISVLMASVFVGGSGSGEVLAEAGGADVAPAVMSVIVRTSPGSGRVPEVGVERLGGRVVERYGSMDSFLAEIPAGGLSGLERLDGVVSATPNGQVESLGSEWINDTDMGSLYSVTKGAGVHTAFGYSDASGRKITGEGIGVALIDSGVVPVRGLASPGQVVNGPDLSFESQAPGLATLDTFGHGTHMAGVIAGRDPEVERGSENNSRYFVGVAPRSTLVNVKVAAADGAVDVSQVIAAIDWVVAHRNDPGLNIRVINLSYGTRSTQSYLLDPLAHAVEVAWRKGIVVVVAGGNDGNATASLTDPAFDPYVIAVGSSDHRGTEDRFDDGVATYSNRGSAARPPDLLAPGRSIVSLRAPGSYIDQGNPVARVQGDYDDGYEVRFFRGSGTSQAAAVVSGVAALMLQYRPNLTPDQLKCMLTLSADRIPGVDVRLQGAGLLDVKQAIESPVPSCVQRHTPSTGTGTLEGARGGSHVADPDTGIELIGERDIFGAPWDGRTWSTAASQGRTWSGGVWNGRTWSGSTWSSSGWTGRTWSGVAWSGTNWSGRTWSGRTWSSAVWSGDAWTGGTWSGRTWSGRTWSGRTWSGHVWR